MQESDIIPAKDNSSFEILSSSEEEDYVSLTMHSSTLLGSFSESMSSTLLGSFSESKSSTLLGSFSESMNSSFSAESAAKDKNLRANSNVFKESNFSSLGDSICYLEMHEELTHQPQFASEVLKPEPSLENATETEDDPTAERKIGSFTALHNSASGLEESISEDGTEPTDRCQLVGKGENFTTPESATGLRRGTETSIVAGDAGFSSNQEQRNFSKGEFLLPQNNADQHFDKNAGEQSHPNRNNCSVKLCSVVKQTFKLFKWFGRSTYLQNVANGARASFHSFLNTVEIEMNLLMGMKEPLQVLIIADASYANAIQESFNRALSGQVVISSRPEVVDHAVPPLPVGYDSALRLAQCKASKGRRHYDSEARCTVVVTTVRFIEQINPQRWQLLTLLWLDDPNLTLTLHNFTATIPVPNEYVNVARNLTPENYPSKELGLAVTLEEAIGYAIKTRVPNNAEEILCGVHRNAHLKSASDVLAGMYKGYVNRFVL